MCLDVLLAQDVVEALHAGRREHAVQHDVLEFRVQSRIEAAKIRRDIEPERMAARTLLDELALAGIDVGLGRGLLGRLLERLLDRERAASARRRRPTSAR